MIVQNYFPPSLGWKNVIINSNFGIWQRGLTATSVANNSYLADRWRYGKSGSMVHDVARSTDVPTFSESNVFSNFSLSLTSTTADSSIGTTDQCTLQQRIEGYLAKKIIGVPSILTFWVKSSIAGTYCVSLRNLVDRSCVKTFIINSANVWERKEIKFPSSDGSSGTWNFTTGTGLALTFCLAAGSSYVSPTNGAWVVGDYFSLSGQVNAVGNVNNTFKISQVQLEYGLRSTAYEFRPYSEELNMCQRYYEKSFNIDTIPEDAVSTSGALTWRSNFTTTNSYNDSIRYSVSKRATPTISLYNPDVISSDKIRNLEDGVNLPATAVNISEKSCVIRVNSSSVTAGRRLRTHWAASAEL